MNKALISKQYWRICNNPNSLLTKTLKAKYCPHEDIHTYKPKPHSSWIWKTIMGNSSPTLSKGSWRVGRRHNIPLNHPFWYPTKPDAPQHLLLQTSSIANLIDQSRGIWRVAIIQQLYTLKTSPRISSVYHCLKQPHLTQRIQSFGLTPIQAPIKSKRPINSSIRTAYSTTPSQIDTTLSRRSYGNSNSHIKYSLSHGKSFTMRSQPKLN